MKQHKGFILFELLLYALYVGFFAYAFSVMMYQLWRTILIQNKKKEQLITLYTASDIFRRDIHEAPSCATSWKEVADQSLIWHIANGDVGWKQESDRLVRITGQYSGSNHGWSCCIKNVIAQHIEKLHFQVEGHEKIARVTLCIQGESGACEVTVMPCARKLS